MLAPPFPPPPPPLSFSHFLFLFFFSPPSPKQPPTTRVATYRANFPRVSLIGWLYRRHPTFLSPLFPCLPPSRARSHAGCRLFPPFPFSQFTSNFLDVAKRQHRIAQRPARLLSRPASTPKREVCIFTRRSVPSGVPSKPTDRPTNQPFFLFSFSLPYTCYTAWQRFVRRIAVEFLRDNLFEKYFSPFRGSRAVAGSHGHTHVWMYARTHTGAYVADAPRNCETSDVRESMIFPRIYVDYPARHEPCYVSR